MRYKLTDHHFCEIQLTNGHERYDVFGQVRGDIGHALAAAARAEAAALATERHETPELAACAAETREAVRKQAALQEGQQFLFDELRQARAVLRLRGVFQKGREVLLERSVQDAGFGLAANVRRARARLAVRMRRA